MCVLSLIAQLSNQALLFDEPLIELFDTDGYSVSQLKISYNEEKIQRTSDGGNGNHSVSLPIILIKIKVDQMLPFSYISSLLVSIL